ncbi:MULTISPECIES: SEL1-like repeat protein [Veillonella]|uniref:SEL1-like repeat protein n=1 Tax=Veillonella TaxID=29465 RepID=UPI00290358F4|nr:SEL1-like repeat protein [Veillonella sp.]MDU2300545.1 SEL1-like repeat protein [Veillonella sp.]MDU2387391.1 SEL1-like repeat protein [Veillonella sp.]
MKNKSINIIETTDDDKFLINKSIENAIKIFKEDKFVINKLVFDSIELLASAEEAQRELKSKNFMQSFLGVITGSNNKLRDKISNNLLQSNYLAELTLKKLMEEHLISLDLIYSINRKINLMRENLSEDINNLYSIIESYIELTNKRLNNLEANDKFIKWFLTLPDREFNGCSYIQLDNLSKLVCLARDFFDKTNGNWNDDDLLLLKGALRKLDINPNDKTNFLDNILTIYNDSNLRAKYFDCISFNDIEHESFLVTPLVLNKLNKFYDDEYFLLNTCKEFSKSKFNDLKIVRTYIQDYIFNRYYINVDRPIEMYDFLIELVSNLDYLSSENNIRIDSDLDYYKSYTKIKIEEYASELYFKGINFKMDKDYLQAYECLYTSYENGNLDSIYSLAELLFDENFELYNINEAINLCEKGISLGQYDCAYLLGYVYDYGKGIEVNKDLAEKNYQICINNSENKELISNSKFELAGILWRKASDQCDMNNIIKLYEDAINNNNYKAMYFLGDKYYSGYKIEQNYDLAMFYFRMAARFNYNKAQFSIGYMYAKAYGVPCNYESAKYWYELAASNGHTTAMNNLGVMYDDGLGVSKDRDKAFELYRMAYDSSDNPSNEGCIMCNIGMCYKLGHGTKKNLEEAKYWFSLSAKAGYKNAEKQLQEVYKLLK